MNLKTWLFMQVVFFVFIVPIIKQILEQNQYLF